jgi:aromatic-L-amino-acid decarboxylase
MPADERPGPRTPTSASAPRTEAADARGRHGSLDPQDWAAFRAEAHRALDDAIDQLASIRERSVWRPIPDFVRASLSADLPRDGMSLDAIYDDYCELVRPYALGNVHPRFFGWVHGGGTPTGMIAEMLAGSLNANLGGREHAPVLVERQVLQWAKAMFGFPETASGVLVTGSSMANLIAVLVARFRQLGLAGKQEGVRSAPAPLCAYTSQAAHNCIRKAMEISGLGSDALRLIETDADGAMRLDALRARIDDDRRAGFAPFLVVGTAGTVDTGAFDDLRSLAELCAAEGLWFHVDGAFGAMAKLAPDLSDRVVGLERADSLAFDFHKWMQVPYDAGCILVRDADLHRRTFANDVNYLARAQRGAGSGDPWFCDFGPDLSRGFRALKVWFTLRQYGTERLGQVASKTCRLARHLGATVERSPQLELAAPVGLNIVCFRYVDDRLTEAKLDALNTDIVETLHEDGIAVPSTTRLSGRLVIRTAIVNHRTDVADLDMLAEAVIAIGDRLVAERIGSAGQAGP